MKYSIHVRPPGPLLLSQCRKFLFELRAQDEAVDHAVVEIPLVVCTALLRHQNEPDAWV